MFTKYHQNAFFKFKYAHKNKLRIVIKKRATFCLTSVNELIVWALKLLK